MPGQTQEGSEEGDSSPVLPPLALASLEGDQLSVWDGASHQLGDSGVSSGQAEGKCLLSGLVPPALSTPSARLFFSLWALDAGCL